MTRKMYRVLREFRWTTGGPLFDMVFKPGQIIEDDRCQSHGATDFLARGWIEEAGPGQWTPVYRF